MATKTALAGSPPLAGRRADTYGGPVLGSRGEVLVSDSSYAHLNMSPRNLRDARFSPGLGQADSALDTLLGGEGSPVPGRRQRARAPSIIGFRRPRYEEQVVSTWGTLNGDTNVSLSSSPIDDDEPMDARSRSARRRGVLPSADEMLARHLAAQQAAAAAAAAVKPFSPTAVRAAAAPTVPRAADAALHTPAPSSVKIFSERVDYSHVQAKVVVAPPSAAPASAAGHERSRPEAFQLPRRRYDNVKAQVPTAQSAREHRPAGGNVTLPARPALPWLAETPAPQVPTAAAAALHRPRAPTVQIFSEKVSFAEHAAPRAVPVLAKDAATYKPAGGHVDVFLWKRDPAKRREAAPRKSEAQILEELFPSQQSDAPATHAPTIAELQHAMGGTQQRQGATTSSGALTSPPTARRRRGMEL